MKKIKFLIALWVSKSVMLLAKILHKNGSMISGKVAISIQKDFVKYFSNIDYDKTIFITGTNGKSTTTNLLAHTIKKSDRLIATNIEGANMMSGVATTLVKNSNIFGKFNKEFLVLEIDERSLQKIYEYLPARNLCVSNIQKDQVQRNGEPDYIYKKIQSVINDNMRLFLNNEEARSKSFEDFTKDVIYYSVTKNEKSFTKEKFYDVTMPCPKCNNKIYYNYYNVDNIGDFKCMYCDFKSESKPNFKITNIDYEKNQFTCNNELYDMPYNQAFFMYNYALVIAICKTFGIEYKQIKEAFKSFKNISGRLETIHYKDKKIKYIRMKQENPETLQSAFDYIAQDKTNKVFMLGLEQLEDFKPYYTNTFYAFDCDLDELIDSNIEKYICFSKAVSYDTANRLIYAGVEREKIVIIPSDSNEEIFKEIDKCECDNIYLITWLHKYEELIEDVKKGEKNEK
ncbi:MAG: DUF1727 domain-containing protein [Firmicutes bacterium]|nr:DUF1727 domain-containing protein [Bacillota bacterium]